MTTELEALVNTQSPALRTALSTLPGLDDARAALAAAKVTFRNIRPRSATEATDVLVAEATAALVAGDELPDDFGTRALAAARINEENVITHGILQQVISQLESHRDTHLHGDLSRVFHDLHRQLTTEIIPAAIPLAKTLKGINDPVSAIDADLGAEWKAAQKLTGQYRDLRKAQQQMMRNAVRSTHPTYDLDAWDLMRNVLDVLPHWRAWKQFGYLVESGTQRRVAIKPPWPADPNAWEFLVWLATSDAEPWVPTPAAVKALRDEASKRPVEPATTRVREESDAPTQLVDPTELPTSKSSRMARVR